MSTAIPLVVVPSDDDTYSNLRAQGAAIADGDFLMVNPSGRSVLLLLLDKSSYAVGTLAVPTQPTAGDTMTIGIGAGQKVYTYRATADYDADGEIEIKAGGVSLTRASIIAAINGTDAHNSAHTQVVASAGTGNNIVITAISAGAIGNVIVTTETFTAGGNVFDAATLGTTTSGGVASATTVTVKAVDDPYGRGGGGDGDIAFALSNPTDSGQIYCLNRYNPVMWNQSGSDIRKVKVTLSGTAGSGRLVALGV